MADEKINWSDIYLKDKGPQDQWIGDKPLSSVLTKEFMGKKGIPAALSQHWKAGHVDDPQTKLSIYAAGRFPDLPKEEREKRYGFHEGEIVYMGEDGKLYRETPDTWVQKLKRFAGEEAAHAPSLILGSVAAGLTGGWSMVAAMAGAAAGEAARKTVGKYGFDEPQTMMGNIGDIAAQGLLAGAGEKVSRGVLRAANWVGAKKGGRLAAAAGKHRAQIDIPLTKRIRQSGKEYGIDLSGAETTGSRRLANEYNLLGDLEPTADLIQADRLKRMSQIESAMPKLLKRISKPEKTLLHTSEKLVEAAEKAVKLPVKVRRAKASPLYKKALGENPDVNINEVVSYIDDKLLTAKGEIRNHLKKAKQTLMKPDLGEESEVLDTSLRGLHGAKMEIDRALNSARRDGLGNTIKRNYRKIQDLLLKSMDDASPDYQKARKIFSSYSQEVDKQSVKTLVGNIAKLKGDQKINAVKKLLGSPESHPEVIKKAARQIHKQDPKVLGQSLRHWMQEEFAKISNLATDDITNIGGMFQKMLFGSKLKKQKIKAISDVVDKDMYGNIEKLMEVFKRTGLIMRKESTTAARQYTLKEGLANKLIRAQTRPLYTFPRILGDFIRSKNKDVNLKRLANAMVSEDAGKQLEKMVQIPEKSQKLLTQFGTFLSMVAGNEFKTRGERKARKDVLPKSMQPSLKALAR